MRADMARLFVAIELPEAWLTAIGAMQASLRKDLPGLRYVRPEGVHLTLAFIGEVARERLEAIAAALPPVAASVPPFGLTLDPPGFFGPARRPRVVWLGLGGDLAALGALQQRVVAALAPLALARDERAFRPHLTLARTPDALPDSEAARIPAAVEGLPRRSAQRMAADTLTLMESELGPGGARYTARERWRLGATST